jgi:hypothetical protein
MFLLGDFMRRVHEFAYVRLIAQGADVGLDSRAGVGEGQELHGDVLFGG